MKPASRWHVILRESRKQLTHPASYLARVTRCRALAACLCCRAAWSGQNAVGAVHPALGRQQGQLSLPRRALLSAPISSAKPGFHSFFSRQRCLPPFPRRCASEPSRARRRSRLCCLLSCQQNLPPFCANEALLSELSRSRVRRRPGLLFEDSYNSISCSSTWSCGYFRVDENQEPLSEPRTLPRNIETQHIQAGGVYDWRVVLWLFCGV